jgi:hypothetical protein
MTQEVGTLLTDRRHLDNDVKAIFRRLSRKDIGYFLCNAQLGCDTVKLAFIGGNLVGYALGDSFFRIQEFVLMELLRSQRCPEGTTCLAPSRARDPLQEQNPRR